MIALLPLCLILPAQILCRQDKPVKILCALVAILTMVIDVSAFFTWFVENYPQSREIMKNNPLYQFRFK